MENKFLSLKNSENIEIINSLRMTILERNKIEINNIKKTIK